jgi:5-methyltetrahydrofolate--homocysteine methyltransferase
MADIQLRFHRDVLALSSPIDATLASQGVDMSFGATMEAALDPEAVHDALKLQQVAGAPCLVAPTEGITRARLAHHRAADRDAEIAAAAKSAAAQFRPQHLICEIGPTGLPLDPTSKASLSANRDQYARAVEAIGPEGVDAFFLNGLASAADVRCALMGVRKLCATPVIASVDVDSEGRLAGREPIEEVVAIMQDLEADVAGFCTGEAPDIACAFARRAAAACDVPLLVQLDVKEAIRGRAPRAFERTLEDNPYGDAARLGESVPALVAAGAQFLRATGNAMPAHTGVLAAASAGLVPVR